MANKRPKPEEIVTKLRQVDVLVGQGVQRVDAIREVRITEQTYYRWRKQYGGMGSDRDVPILLWPFYAIWRLLTFVVELVGRLLCGVIGLGLMVAGTAITITVLAAPVGIPLAAVGLLLLVRAIF